MRTLSAVPLVLIGAASHAATSIRVSGRVSATDGYRALFALPEIDRAFADGQARCVRQVMSIAIGELP